MELREVLGIRVKQLRLAQGLTLAELSKRTGLKEQYLNRVEKGEHQVTLKNLQVVATGLGVQPGDLLEIEVPGQNENRLLKLETALKLAKKALDDVL